MKNKSNITDTKSHNIYNITKLENELKIEKTRYIVVFSAFSIFICIYILMFVTDIVNFKELLISIFFGVVVILGMFLYYTISKIGINDKINFIKFQLQTQEIILSDDENIYSKSIKMSYTYLNKYYAQTQEQASKGFFVTVIISLFGAVIIILGILSMYFGITEPAYITVATGALTEIISSVFFYLYNKTITSMSKYHDKLVLSQNVAYALEIVDTISDNEKDEAKKELMRELVKDINLHLQKSDQD